MALDQYIYLDTIRYSKPSLGASSLSHTFCATHPVALQFRQNEYKISHWRAHEHNLQNTLVMRSWYRTKCSGEWQKYWNHAITHNFFFFNYYWSFLGIIKYYLLILHLPVWCVCAQSNNRKRHDIVYTDRQRQRLCMYSSIIPLDSTLIVPSGHLSKT